MKRVLLLMLLAAVATAVGAAALAGADDGRSPKRLGNHTLQGTYEFRADGVVEVNGEPERGFWEVGRFHADGRGRITQGTEYSSLLSSHDEATIDRPFTFSGTYSVRPDGVATGQVAVTIAPGVVINKKLWLIVHSVGKDGIANGFDGGHAMADLGHGMHGNARSHVGHRIRTAR